LISEFSKGDDPFLAIASTIFDIEVSRVTTELRKRAKSATYGVLYGMGAKSLSEDLNVSLQEAESLILDFRTKYPAIPTYHQSIIDSCIEKGFVTTIMNRRRYLPKIYSSNIIERFSVASPS
jgi:DNA polymerase-1